MSYEAVGTGLAVGLLLIVLASALLARLWGDAQDEPEEHRWNLVRVIRGEDGSRYLTRIELTPPTPCGQLFLHLFHRPDKDPHHHDHPWDFRTFPLMTYHERTLRPDGLEQGNRVRPWRWHQRPASYAHSVVDWPMRQWRVPLVTIVWRAETEQRWAFVVPAALRPQMEATLCRRVRVLGTFGTTGERPPPMLRVWWRDYLAWREREARLETIRNAVVGAGGVP